MGGKIGQHLRKLRTARGERLSHVARIAGVNETTLGRWERDETQPRVPELKMVLAALEVGPQEQTRLIGLIRAPRAASQEIGLCRETAKMQPVTACIGDLWTALRVRHGSSPAQIAQEVRKRGETITRIEAGKLFPSGDLFNQLVKLYEPSEAEQAALAERYRIVLPVDFAQHRTWKEWEAWVQVQVIARMNQDKNLLEDLGFINLEAYFTTFASKDERALRLLAITYVYHADYLLWKGRLDEMATFARRALYISEGRIVRQAYWLKAVGLWARRYKQTNPRKSLSLLTAWEPAAVIMDNTTTLYRDMADYAGILGQFQKANALLQQSRRAADRWQHPDDLLLADIIEARLHIRMGKPEKALALQESVHGLGHGPQATVALQMAEAALLCNERSEAECWLNRFYALIHAHRFEHMRAEGDRLAQRL